MALDFNGTTQYLSQNSCPITAYPLTIAAWFNSDSTSNTRCITQAVGKNGSNGNQSLRMSGNNLQANSNDGAGASQNAQTSAAFSAGVWNHGCAVFAANNSRSIYLNGGNKQTNTSTVNMIASPDRMNIAQQQSSTGTSLFFDGRIQEVGIWSVVLDDSEIAALAKGVCPLLIRPTGLLAYYPLFGNLSPEPDRWKNRLDMTLNNTPLKADHYPQLYPMGVRS